MTAAVPVPQPPGNGQIEFVELTVRVDATMTVGTYGEKPSEWMKTGAEGKVHMNGIPVPEQIQTAYNYIQVTMLEPAMTQMINTIHEKLVEQRRMG
jgi:hypothetical protein